MTGKKTKRTAFAILGVLLAADAVRHDLTRCGGRHKCVAIPHVSDGATCPTLTSPSALELVDR